MAVGKTIQIFLPDGNPRGVRIAEITSRTVQAVAIPRSQLDIASARAELANVGVYFLIGSPEVGAKALLYVGEAENCRDRLRLHNRNKDFWNVAIAVVSRTAHFTKSHVKYLEWYCYEQAKAAGRFSIENSSVPTKAYVPEAVEADLLDNFDTIKILVATLGQPIFERMQRPTQDDILVCRGKNAFAKGQYSEDGLVVFAGSKCNLKETESASPSVHNMRKKLIDQGILEQDGNVYVFAQDYIFDSPSGAAKVVLARNVNGWASWKYKNGKTLDDVKRRSEE